ncbi:MAG: hypothetical protein KDN05_18620 [Verrucomicrobiae bacterium]|nr:hypothetical protein [Verrucomicrobiae bacterium]
MKILRKRAMVWVCMLLMIVAGFLLYLKRLYPHGMSHCCILGMMMALEEYAGEHDGRYPWKDETPEAALGRLHREGLTDANTLRGMIVPLKAVEEILDRGGDLGPASCGWHYVPGLTLADDRKLAFLWCKEPLEHNGQRSHDGGREVLFVGGERRWISGSRWQSFLKEQEDLLKQRSPRESEGRALVTGAIEMPDGRRPERIDEPYSLTEACEGPTVSGSGSSSGSSLRRSDLDWFRAPLDNGTVTRTLSFAGLTSGPVTVRFTNGEPDVSEVVFRMRNRQ